MRSTRLLLTLTLTMVLVTASADYGWGADQLPSWNEGAAKKSITDFVTKVTTAGSPDFVKAAERIAVFDNDGTLWCEQPLYTQLVFAFDRVRAMAPDHPDWKDKEPFKAIIAGDVKGALSGGEKTMSAALAATHAGMTTSDFEKIVEHWIATAKHPRFERRYTDLAYQPMIELLAYLRANGFKTFIVSGGGVEFMRPWTERVYGIPPEQVVGSRGKLKFEATTALTNAGAKNGVPVLGKPEFELLKLPEVDFIDDGPGKPVGIQQMIGRRPIMAFGNSDGDLQMLQWTTTGDGPRFGLIVHHTDAVREYAYDRDSPVGRLDKALDAAPKYRWTVASMKTDWKTIFAGERPAPSNDHRIDNSTSRERL